MVNIFGTLFKCFMANTNPTEEEDKKYDDLEKRINRVEIRLENNITRLEDKIDNKFDLLNMKIDTLINSVRNIR